MPQIIRLTYTCALCVVKKELDSLYKHPSLILFDDIYEKDLKYYICLCFSLLQENIRK